MDVLLLEDDRNLARALSFALKHGGYTPLLARDLRSARALIEQSSLAAAVLEHHYPKDGALEIARLLKRAKRNIPVIHFSRSFLDPETLDLTRLRPLFNAFLSRPLWHFDLLDALERLTSGTRHESLANLPRFGELDGYPFENLLYQASNAAFTGRIVLQRAASRRVLYLLNGFPVFASSNTLGQALGTLLIKRGLIDRESLKAELESLEHRKTNLGQHLIRERYITPDELSELLYEQVRERVLSCFDLKGGQFELFPGANFPNRFESFVQNPIELIFLGVARFYETNILAEKFAQRASHHVVPTNKFQRLIPYAPLGEKRAELLSHINGQLTVQQLIRHWSGDITALFRFLWALSSARLIFLSRKPIPSTRPDISRLLIPIEHLAQLVTPSPIAHDDHPELSSGVIDSADLELDEPPHKSVSQLDRLLERSDQLSDLNHFELLGLDIDASPTDIRQRVEHVTRLLDPKQVSKLPPEMFTRAARLWTHLQAATRVILDPERREAYRRKLRPASVQSLIAEGRAALKADDVDRARALFRQAESIDPANAQAVTYFARAIHLASGTADRRVVSQCQALLFRAIALDEVSPLPHYFLGELALDRDRGEEAREHFQRALDLDPAFEPAMHGLEALGDEGPDTGNIRASFLKYED